MTVDVRDLGHFPWLAALSRNPLPTLLDAAPLPIRFQILKDLLDDQQSADFLSLQQNLRKHQPRRKLLAAQDAQGRWPIGSSTRGLQPDQLATLQFIRQMEVLHELAELQTTRKQHKAELGMREVIRYLAATPDQQLRLHHYIQAIYLALRYELFGNPIIKQLVWELLKHQNADGGWSSLAGEPSDYWTTLWLVNTLGTAAQFQKNRSLRKALKYLSEHYLHGDQSRLLPGLPAWDTLLSGTQGLAVLSGGSLRLLETLQLYETETIDRLQDKLISWLTDIQLKNGLWPSIVKRDRQGDHGVSLRVLKALKHFYEQRQVLTAAYTSNEQ